MRKLTRSLSGLCIALASCQGFASPVPAITVDQALLATQNSQWLTAVPSNTTAQRLQVTAKGLQVLNTLFPFGAALPKTGTPAQLQQVFAQRETVLTDLFKGVTTQAHIMAVGVPVVVNDRVVYSLNMGLTPDYINRLIAQRPLPDGWLIAVLDRSRTIVGRSRDPLKFIGQPVGLRAAFEVVTGPSAAEEGS